MSSTEPSTESSAEIPAQYNPQAAEARWYDFWENNGYFTASDSADDARPTYAVTFPPPNVTGSLHMGHACRVTFPDVIVRYERMRGKNVLWQPGLDHAGIATQVVVERLLAREGKTKHDLGREAFTERVWNWKAESGGRILEQLRKMGASLDWQRTLFTLDKGPADAVREVFVRLYEEGLIYRAPRLINWDVKLQTSLSDLEVETKENVDGELFDFAYPLEDGSGEVVVSTTRPETMLGDTAIAVHPDDERYKAIHGKFVKHPFVDRLVPVITDAVLVDPKFGTGVVKVTPAHDPKDFETGKRHSLPEISIFSLDGKVNANGGAFQGMDRYAARKAVKAKLAELGLTRGTRKHMMTLPISQRSGEVVEPMISTQWFIRMEPLAKPAIEAVEDGRIRIQPEEWTKTYFHWMRNIQDWCISRQLWWGHPIPAWFCGACDHITVARETPAKCGGCGGTALKQDEDVLDTWFSSALWPFSTLGWPEKTPALEKFYPNQDMETGYDILFFWVARMIMMGMHFMGDVPFRRVLLAGIVTDERGDKMSKVKGNVVDPLDVVNGATLDDLVKKAEAGGASESARKYLATNYPDGFAAYGADALRMTLLSYSPESRRIALSLKRVEGYRNFSNKLWNAARFSLQKLEGSEVRALRGTPRPKHLTNRWILSRLDDALGRSRTGIEGYRIDDASGALYHFVWDEFCDWYLELSKGLLASDDASLVEETRATLVHTLEVTLRALHPMMPFITEDLWQRVPKAPSAKPSIMISPYPEAGKDARPDEHAERDMKDLQTAVVGIRTVRAEHDLPRAKHIPVVLRSDNAFTLTVLAREIASITALVNATLTIESDGRDIPENSAVAVKDTITVIVPLEGLVDKDKERERLTRDLGRTQKDLAQLEAKLKNAGFVERAPKELVEAERAKLAELQEKRSQFEKALAKLS